MDEKNTEQNITPAEQTTQSAAPESPITLTSVVIVVLVGLLALGGWYFLQQQSDDADTTPTLEDAVAQTESLPMKDYPEVVAVVNGEEISSEAFITSYTQVSQTAAAQGADLTDEGFIAQAETQAVDVLVNTLLLEQAATAAGYVVDEEAVAVEIAAIEAQYGGAEGLDAVIAENDLSREGVVDDVRSRLLINQYLEAQTDILDLVVTEADVQAFYDSFAGGAQEMPPIEDVYAQIESQLVSQKQQAAVNDVISQLREEAEVEITL